MKSPGRWKPLFVALAGIALICALAFPIRALLAQWRLPRGPYRIGWEVDPPEQVQGKGAEPTGLAIDLVRDAARRRGIQLRWVHRDEGSEAALRSGAVDLWPLITVTPERLRVFHISAPYVDALTSFMVRRDGPFQQLEDLSGQTVGYVSTRASDSVPAPIDLQLARRFLPAARLVPRSDPHELIESICNGDLAAGYIEQNVVIQTMMIDGVGCAAGGFAMITPPNSRISLGIGSTRRAAAVADALRDEMDAMALDGSMEKSFARWGYLSGRSVAFVDALRNLRQRERWIRNAGLFFAFLLALATLQSWRVRQKSRRARQAETALRSREDLFRLFMDNSPVLAWMKDAQGRYIYMSEPFRRYFGLQPGLSPNTTDFDIYPHAVADQLRRNDQAALSAGQSIEFTEETPAPDGSLHSWHVYKFPFHDVTGQVFVSGIALDVTERKRAEEEYVALQAQFLQAQKLETVGRLAGGIAHDFNNLLTVIIGYSHKLLIRLEPNHLLRPPLTHISAAAEKAAALTAQLLAFSRRNAGAPRTISLAELVAGIQPMVRSLVEERIEVIVELKERNGRIFADPVLVEQVVINLAMNARDAMPEQGRLFIETARFVVSNDFAAQSLSVPQGDYFTLTVTDTGTGMTPEVQAQLFQPFFTTKEPSKGTGLGLATVYGIVKQSGGAIRVHSTPGLGTSVRIFFPAVDSALDEPEPPVDEAPLFGTETVLLVEDEARVRNFVREILEEHGYRVLDASNGLDALGIARHLVGARIDLLLTDIVMPRMNGMELIRQLETFRPGVRVLRMSGYPDRVCAEVDSEIPWLLKPFTPAALLKKVRETLDTVRSSQTT